jgi:uncharacterized protein YegP (UPF0339 family)
MDIELGALLALLTHRETFQPEGQERRSAMATATQKVHSRGQQGDDAPTHGGASTEFLIFEDNGGAYHWAFTGGDGSLLVRSEGCASHDDAQRAARQIRDAFAAPLDLGHGSS